MFVVESMKGINLNSLEISVVYRFAYKLSTGLDKHLYLYLIVLQIGFPDVSRSFITG